MQIDPLFALVDICYPRGRCLSLRRAVIVLPLDPAFPQEVADDASLCLCDRDLEPFGQIAKPPLDLGKFDIDIQFEEPLSYLFGCFIDHAISSDILYGSSSNIRIDKVTRRAG